MSEIECIDEMCQLINDLFKRYKTRLQTVVRNLARGIAIDEDFRLLAEEKGGLQTSFAIRRNLGIEDKNIDSIESQFNNTSGAYISVARGAESACRRGAGAGASVQAPQFDPTTGLLRLRSSQLGLAQAVPRSSLNEALFYDDADRKYYRYMH
jgi:hypothetical protein